jgi:hypothetical protein
MLTKKALIQTEELSREIDVLLQQKEQLQNESVRALPFEKQMYSRECSKLYNRIYQLQRRIDEIKRLGIATRERATIIKSIQAGRFTILTATRDIASTTMKATGYLIPLDSYGVVEYTQWSRFVRNVRGCSLKAGTVEINTIELIPTEQHDVLVKDVYRNYE